VIAVASDRFGDWIRFAGGMSVKLPCNRDALDAWWHGVSARGADPTIEAHPTVCEVLK
jgi:hypothetical protein